MLRGNDYLTEIKKFTTSQYWATGVRITAGVMIPTIVLARFDWLASGMPFLWGALFVSITDSPGPIRHRRNGLLTALALNTFTIFITVMLRGHVALLLLVIALLGFFYSLISVFGNRAGAIGVLALVIMLLNLAPRHTNSDVNDILLTFAGGIWYTLFSLALYTIRPYRLAEQAVGENIIAIARYLQTRASLYKEGADIKETFNRVIQQQSNVLKSQDQAREILFKTRQFVGDASPKSRSLMMIFIESIDLLEQAMTAYQDYDHLHQMFDNTGLLNRFHGLILQMSAELEHIGLLVQSGSSVKKDMMFTSSIGELVDALHEAENRTADKQKLGSLEALKKSLANLHQIAAYMQRLVGFTRLEIETASYAGRVASNAVVITQPIRWQELRENFTLKSNSFRHALRLTSAMLVGYAVSAYFSLSHAYWVLLTIVTILKPVYATSRKRNIQRVSGTLLGAVMSITMIYFIHSKAALLVILIFSMIMGYSLLRVNYFSFVLFLTIYIVITFHFLNPEEFRVLILDRLLDTVVGSIIAFLAARFVLPVWGSEEIEGHMQRLVKAAANYFNASWQSIVNPSEMKVYETARKDAIVALTNLSDTFQRIISEPVQNSQSIQVHQFVIASHLLVGHIAALRSENMSKDILCDDRIQPVIKCINTELTRTENKLTNHPDSRLSDAVAHFSPQVPLQLLSIYDLSHDLRMIAGRMQVK